MELNTFASYSIKTVNLYDSTIKLRLMIPLFALLFSFNNLYAKDNQLIICLGKEEMTLHSEGTAGAQYLLNQLFLNELITVSNIHAHSSYTEKICKHPKFPPSVALLYFLIIDGKSVFNLEALDPSKSDDRFQIAAVDNLRERLPFIFMQYISDLQSMAPTHDCMIKEIPELEHFIVKIKYLEDELPPKELLNDKPRIMRIFTKLENISTIMKRCQESLKKKNKVPPKTEKPKTTKEFLEEKKKK